MATDRVDRMGRVSAEAIDTATIIGRYDGSGRPGLFDSVIQAAWSFCLALRARGLGTAWTTAILGAEEELAQLLGLPADVTPVALIPVAWTPGQRVRTRPPSPGPGDHLPRRLCPDLGARAQ